MDLALNVGGINLKQDDAITVGSLTKSSQAWLAAWSGNTTEWQSLADKQLVWAGLKAGWGQPLGETGHFVWVNGSQKAERFDFVSDVSATSKLLMQQYEHGVWMDLGDGADTVVGSPYWDDISVTLNRTKVGQPGYVKVVDAGTELGTFNWGGKGRDSLQLYIDKASLNGQSVSASAFKVDQSTDGSG